MRLLKIQTLPKKDKEHPWIDRTEILFHAIFQVFEDFIKEEYSNEHFNLEPWDLTKVEEPSGYFVEDNEWKLKCKEILAFWEEMKKHSSCWSRAHSELEHKLGDREPDFDSWLEPPDEHGNRKVKQRKEPSVYWDTLKEMGELEEYYEDKINEYCHWIISKRRWMWT